MSGAQAVRPARTCGIHGDDTTSGRCATCDQARAAREWAALVDGAWSAAVQQLGADGLEDAARGLDAAVFQHEQQAATLRKFAARLRQVAADVRVYPHDLACPGCGRRQWTDDDAPDTCQACGFTWPGDRP